jgi:transcriptional regulator with XRE-family HTH domain
MFAASPSGTQRSHPGNLGRRITRRREELGLTIEELADQAGMAPAFLEWVVTRPADLGPGGIARVAAALSTSPQDLLGGELGSPPGRRGLDRRTVSHVLTAAECLDRLGTQGVGRVVFQMSDTLVVRPVNYQVAAEGSLLFRTQPGGTLAQAVGRHVVMEVDRLDDVLAQGWSVLVSGTAEEEDRRDASRPGLRQQEPQPWAARRRDLLVRICPSQLTGRELRPGATHTAPADDTTDRGGGSHGRKR